MLAGDSDVVTWTRGLLTAYGFEVAIERDTEGALGALAESAFDLLISDWHLEPANGIELCSAIRRWPRLSCLPIVALISAESGHSASEALAAGADEFLATPCAPAELLARVRATLRSARLSASEARLRALMSIVPGAIYRCAFDSDWTMEIISDEIERISGYPAPDFVNSASRSFASIIHSGDRQSVEDAVVEAAAEGRPFTMEYRIVGADGAVVWVQERGQMVRGHSGRCWLDGVIFDLTERKRTEEELRANLARQAAGNARARIARDLHDSVSQALFSMTLHARAAQISLEGEGIGPEHDAVRNIAELHQLTQNALAEMRALIFELRPAALQEEGLVAALQKHAAAVTAREQLTVEVSATNGPLELEDSVQEELYSLAQEALHNVVKHAQASAAQIVLKRDPAALDTLVLEVRDDGCGFDDHAPRPGHLGLITMRERAERAGGRLTVDSRPGAGTTVRATVPRAMRELTARGERSEE